MISGVGNVSNQGVSIRIPVVTLSPGKRPAMIPTSTPAATENTIMTDSNLW